MARKHREAVQASQAKVAKAEAAKIKPKTISREDVPGDILADSDKIKRFFRRNFPGRPYVAIVAGPSGPQMVSSLDSKETIGVLAHIIEIVAENS